VNIIVPIDVKVKKKVYLYFVKIAIVQAADQDYANKYMGCIKSVESYCVRHGYSHFAELPVFPDIVPAYQKPYFMLSKIRDFDYIMWIDVDCFIANPEVKIEEHIISKYRDRDLIYSDDPSPGWPLNSGVVIFKNSKKGVDMLWEWWNRAPKTHKPKDPGIKSCYAK